MNTKYPPHLYGIHDLSPDWVNLILGAGRTGWATTTHAIGSDPNDKSGEIFDTRDDKIGIIARLNHAYGSGGTLPLPAQYANFAQRCANFVAASRGISFVIIGNEINHTQEYPEGQPISLDDYMRCYLLCYDAIKRVAPHVGVGVAAMATWSNKLAYPGNERGDWVKLQSDAWRLAGSKQDALFIHAYSHGYDPNLIVSAERMGAPFQDRYYHFQVYSEFMAAVPAHLRKLPVFITETNGDGSWAGHNSGWIRAMYEEVNRWNRLPGAQQIWAACLFRWAIHDQKWDISQKSGSIDDFRMALQADHRYKKTSAAEIISLDDVLQLRVVDDVKFRVSPGSKGKTAADVMDILPVGTILNVVGPTQSVDGLTWWNVKLFNDKGSRTGWVAQSAPDDIELVEVVGSDLVIGQDVESTTSINVRQAPGRQGQIVKTVGARTKFTLIGGPHKADGLLWWQTREGWVAEAASGVKLIDKPKSDVIARLSTQYEIEEKVVRAIVEIESGKSGFTGYGLKIRFEPHVFLARLKDPAQRSLFAEKFQMGAPSWVGDYHKMNQDGHWVSFHDGGGRMEHQALNLARSINEPAAYESISAGAPQVMGFHYKMLGYSSAKEMYEAFSKDEETQIAGMFKFFEASGLIPKIRAKDFRAVAATYNGEANVDIYSKLIENAYNR